MTQKDFLTNKRHEKFSGIEKSLGENENIHHLI